MLAGLHGLSWFNRKGFSTSRHFVELCLLVFEILRLSAPDFKSRSLFAVALLYFFGSRMPTRIVFGPMNYLVSLLTQIVPEHKDGMHSGYSVENGVPLRW